MWNRNTRSLGMTFVVIASVAALTANFRVNAAPEPDNPRGEITLLAPCDAEEHPFAVKKLVKDMMSTFKLGTDGTVFATSATVTSDADNSIFVLTLKIEQSGKVVSAGHMQSILNKGESGNLATLCAVIPSRDTYSVSADVRIVGAIKALDSRNCQYTAR